MTEQSTKHQYFGLVKQGKVFAEQLVTREGFGWNSRTIAQEYTGVTYAKWADALADNTQKNLAILAEQKDKFAAAMDAKIAAITIP